MGDVLRCAPGRPGQHEQLEPREQRDQDTSADYAGLKSGGLYSLGGVAGQFNRNQIWSVGTGDNNRGRCNWAPRTGTSRTRYFSVLRQQRDVEHDRRFERWAAAWCTRATHRRTRRKSSPPAARILDRRSNDRRNVLDHQFKDVGQDAALL